MKREKEPIANSQKPIGNRRVLLAIAYCLSAIFAHGREFLIVTPDDFLASLAPLVRWKRERGYNVEVRRLSEIGGAPAQIRSYIVDRHNAVGLRYCLLVGAINRIRAFPIPRTSVITDYFYGCVDGDLRQDVYIGRLPASNVGELDVMVAKVLSYEKSPEMGDTFWFKRGLGVATSFVEGHGAKAKTAIETKRWWRRLLLGEGFERVDTVFHDEPPHPSPESIPAAINRGVLFVNGRGWGNYEGWHYPRFYRSDVANLSNGFKLPVVTSLYCANGNFNANPCFGEVWLRAGSPSFPRGGVLFFGPTSAATSTRFNNILDAGIYEAIFERRLVTAGEVFNYAKERLFENFPLPSDSFNRRLHIQTYNILGDPTLWLWRGVPKRLSPSYPGSIAVGSQRVTVSVPGIKGAWVCFYKEGDCQVFATTDSLGNCRLDVTTQSEGFITLTISAPCYLPFQVSLPVERRGVHLGFHSLEISSPTPGERQVFVAVANSGNDFANNVFATLRSESEDVVVLDSVVGFGTIAPRETSGRRPFTLRILPTASDRETANFSLALTCDGHSFLSGFRLELRSGYFAYRAVRVSDGNNQILEPGEEAELYVRIRNSGREGVLGIQGRLSLLSNAGIILDSLGDYGNFSPGEEKENLDPFRIRLFTDFASNRPLRFRLRLIQGGEEIRKIHFEVHPGPYDPTRPLGPTPYGYYAYDCVDTLFLPRPEYRWVEIDPNFGGAGTRLYLGNDGCRTLPLPFSFRYFGQEFNSITVSANGFCVLGPSAYRDPYNWRIPSPFAPANLLACFWDDFHPDTGQSSGVYYYYETSRNRFIVQWSRVHHIHGFINPHLGELQTFEIILSPSLPEGEVIFQYLFCQNDDSLSGDCHNYATVGIFCPSQREGLLVTYANQYPGGAEVLRPGRAIKFTTTPPDTFTPIRGERRGYERKALQTIMRVSEFIRNWELGPPKLYSVTGRRIRCLRRIGTGIYFYEVSGKIRKVVLVK